LLSAAEPYRFDPNANLIHAPDDPALWPEFRRKLQEWRRAERERLNYSDALYRRADFAWVTSNFSCCFLMLCDETFYDPRKNRYRVKSFLEHGRREFGGYDSVVLWHAYPRIGLDDRNQFDCYRDMPGGLPGLRKVVSQMHGSRVKVYIDYNPWDEKTRREGKDDLDALAGVVKALDVDGIFLDTMDRGAAEFRSKLDAVRKGVVLEGEGALPSDRIPDHHMSWAQGFRDSGAPGVLRNKWFEPRHMQHQIDRWNLDHTAELHTAWMNGSGIMVWENVFGTWNDWSQRDRAILRSMLPIQRHFADLFSGEGWTPLVPTLQEKIYASLWEGPGVRLWTLVNRSNQEVAGELLRVDDSEKAPFYDFVAGRTAETRPGQGSCVLSGRVGPRGIGCFVTGSEPMLGRAFRKLLAFEAALPRSPGEVPKRALETRLRPVSRTTPAKAVPEGMAAIPAVSRVLKVQLRMRECGCYDSAHPQLSGRKFPGLHQPVWSERKAELKPYAMDLTPVTNQQFAIFLKASGYHPRHREKFLAHWIDGVPPEGKQEHPVVYVDLDDARAYAKWAGKRLPTEEEWQYAAQGNDERKFPWGNEMLPHHCNDGSIGTTTPVTAFQEGRSPFGLFDMCGNVWHWTESERSDGRTRFATLRGGSFYLRGGSFWYFDEGPQPVYFAAKMLLMWSGLDRCANIGFRCAVDLPG
jgi:hypothetical protein